MKQKLGTLWQEGTELIVERGDYSADRLSRFFLQEILKLSNTAFYLEQNRVIDDAEKQIFETMIQRYNAGEPVAYVLGTQPFLDYEFIVTPDTLIPREETGLLVEYAVEYLQEKGIEKPIALDIGTGSGCIIISLAAKIRQGIFMGTDISEKALGIAIENAMRISPEPEVLFVASDLYSAIAPKSQFDLIISNPPYIARDDQALDPSVLQYEPHRALFSEEEGYLHIRKLLEKAPFYLTPNGLLMIEIGYNQSQKVQEFALQSGLKTVTFLKDQQGYNRHLVCKLP